MCCAAPASAAQCAPQRRVPRCADGAMAAAATHGTTALQAAAAAPPSAFQRRWRQQHHKHIATAAPTTNWVPLLPAILRAAAKIRHSIRAAPRQQNTVTALGAFRSRRVALGTQQQLLRFHSSLEIATRVLKNRNGRAHKQCQGRRPVRRPVATAGSTLALTRGWHK